MRIHAPEFSLVHTLSSGQVFRYKQVDEGYLVSHRDKAFIISQDGDYLTIHAKTSNVNAKWLTYFFSLDERAPKAVDAYSAEALAYCSGLRVCKQDAWECTIGFMVSQNNNIKRIAQIMNGLAEKFGEKIKLGKYETYLFPNPKQIKSGKKLSSLRLGYREEYVLLASKTITDKWLRTLRELSHEKAKEKLLSIKGIGPKVAACILLFAYQHNAFPIDTWIEQVMREEYGCKNKKEMEAKAESVFGSDAGKLQQYIFHYARFR